MNLTQATHRGTREGLLTGHFSTSPVKTAVL
jgi:hypothetical protein